MRRLRECVFGRKTVPGPNTPPLFCGPPTLDDLLRRLEAAMRLLEPRTREIFLAHRIDELTYGEIARRTGLSVEAVERHMAKAIGQIDRSLHDRRP